MAENKELPPYTRLMIQLDKDQPGWHIEWATQSDMRDLTLKYATEDSIKYRVVSRLVPRIISCAYAVGMVGDASK